MAELCARYLDKLFPAQAGVIPGTLMLLGL